MCHSISDILNQKQSSPSSCQLSTECSSRNINMHPLHSFLHKVLEESSSNRSSRSPLISHRYVRYNICLLNFNSLAMVDVNRHAPHIFMNLLGSFEQVLAQFGRVGEHTSVFVTQGKNTGVCHGTYFN